MTAEAIAHVLLMLWMASLTLLLIRLLLLKLHHQYLLFAASCGIDLIIGTAIVLYGPSSEASAALGLLSSSMDIFIAPAIASELFGAAGHHVEDSPSRQLSPLILTLLAGIGIDLFLLSTPDTDAFQAASFLAFTADTIVGLLIVSYLLRRRRQRQPPADHNLTWLRRVFAVEVVASAVSSLVVFAFESVPLNAVVNTLFFASSFAITCVCVVALRKSPQMAPNS